MRTLLAGMESEVRFRPLSLLRSQLSQRESLGTVHTLLAGIKSAVRFRPLSLARSSPASSPKGGAFGGANTDQPAQGLAVGPADTADLEYFFLFKCPNL